MSGGSSLARGKYVPTRHVVLISTKQGARHPQSLHMENLTTAARVREPGLRAAPDPHERLKPWASARTASLLAKPSLCQVHPSVNHPTCAGRLPTLGTQWPGTMKGLEVTTDPKRWQHQAPISPQPTSRSPRQATLSHCIAGRTSQRLVPQLEAVELVRGVPKAIPYVDVV